MAKASTAAKRRYNNKVYASVYAELPKDLVLRFKDYCSTMGVSQASVIRTLLEAFMKDK